MAQIAKNTFYLFDPVLRTQTSRNLFWILRPFCAFRTYVVLKPKCKKEYKYNGGHSCTYQQLLYGRAPHIDMVADRQYSFLVNQVETELINKTFAATIFKRSITKEYIQEMTELLKDSDNPDVLQKVIQLDKGNGFDQLCRNYVNGQLQDVQDPVLTLEDDIRFLHGFSNRGRLILTPTEPEPIDFKKLIADNLDDTTPKE